MNRIVLRISLMAFAGLMVLSAQEAQDKTAAEPSAAVKPAASDVNLGKVVIPRTFIHAGLEFKAGSYGIVLKKKADSPVFEIRNAKKEVVFEEIAAVKPNPAGMGKTFSRRVKKGLLKDNEYFRIRVEEPDRFFAAYFLIKK